MKTKDSGKGNTGILILIMALLAIGTIAVLNIAALR